MTGAPFPQRPDLRIVSRQPQPRRLEVRFHILDRRAPYARSRAFRLTHDELDELMAAATRMERRA